MQARVLIVEDDPVLAYDLADFLTCEGFQIIGPAASVVAAIGLINDIGCDVAILDVNLGRGTAAPVAAHLRSRSLPFLTLSGYSRDQHPPEFAGSVTMTKPYQERKLIISLRKLLNLA